MSKKYLAETCEGADLSFRLPERRVVRGARTGEYAAGRSRGAQQYQDIFGKENFFLEIQDQGLEAEKKIQADLYRLERELGIPLVATNDSHYLCGEDSHAHEVMLCVQTGSKIHDADRFKFDSDQFFVKSADEMARLFKDSPAVLTRTMEIAERCNLKLHRVDNPFPEFAVPQGHTHRQLLRGGLPRGTTRSGWKLRCGGWSRAACCASTPDEYECAAGATRSPSSSR